MNSIDYKKYPQPRLRHHAHPGLYLPKANTPKHIFHYPPIYSEQDARQFFADGAAPTILDVGCGRGKFTLDFALHHPNEHVLGLELRKSPIEWINEVIAGEQLTNVAVRWYSVANGLPFLQSESISTIFYFFPDPWMKKKHHKRRAFSTQLLDEFARILVPKTGKLFIMTDREEADIHHREVLDTHKRFRYRYLSKTEWPFTETTNQQDFCHQKDIPYVQMEAILE